MPVALAIIPIAISAAAVAYGIYSSENAPSTPHSAPQSGAGNVTYSGSGGLAETPGESAFYQMQSLNAQKLAEQQTAADVASSQAAQTQSTDFQYILIAILVFGLYTVFKKKKFL